MKTVTQLLFLITVQYRGYVITLLVKNKKKFSSLLRKIRRFKVMFQLFLRLLKYALHRFQL
jgi:hypothetical protein